MNLITMIDCMKPIGGYFGWEFPLQQKPIPHERGVFNLIPLPMDQRYNTDDMNRIISIICK